MKKQDLYFEYPEDLVAQTPVRPSRVMWVQDSVPCEIKFNELFAKFQPGDLLVVNDTKVLKRRVFSDTTEILFLKSSNELEWEVLFPAKKFKIGDELKLPKGISMRLVEKGRPQKVVTSQPLTQEYFLKYGELPLPPYIQKARHLRHNQTQDKDWYQAAWAQREGSFAAPTASLHFSQHDLESLKNKGVEIVTTTLHVGLGTFLPVEVEDLNNHVMHSEQVEISAESWSKIVAAKQKGKKIWALGTTVARSLESQAQGYFKYQSERQVWSGETDLLIQPGFDWKVVDRLLTNFHQPESTLLALVSSFSDLETVKSCYRWAIEHKYRLFSYGDLSVWIR